MFTVRECFTRNALSLFVFYRQRKAGIVRIHGERGLAQMAARAANRGAQRGGLEWRHVGPARSLLSGEERLAHAPPDRSWHSSWAGLPSPRGVETSNPRPPRNFQYIAGRELRAENCRFRVKEYRDETR